MLLLIVEYLELLYDEDYIIMYYGVVLFFFVFHLIFHLLFSIVVLVARNEPLIYIQTLHTKSLLVHPNCRHA